MPPPEKKPARVGLRAYPNERRAISYLLLQPPDDKPGDVLLEVRDPSAEKNERIIPALREIDVALAAWFALSDAEREAARAALADQAAT